MPKLADRYPFPAPEGSHWTVPQDFDVAFNWDYDDGRATMMGLYRKGIEMQWDAETRIDWTQELDEDNPEQLPEEMLPISGMAQYESMSRKEKAQVRRHFQGWQISQFMQGEQGALICAAKIVTQVPDVDSKFYASTQVIDEARHVESYTRLLEKFGVAYPMTAPLQELIDQVLRDSRWDMTYLGMQVVIEGLALAAFQQIRDHAQNPLAAAVNAYVMEDEARHVAFGRLALRDAYPHLTQHERDERERVPARGLLPDARPVRRSRGVEDPRPRSGQVRRAHVRFRLHGDVPLVAVHAHRADREGCRPLGQNHPRRL